MSGISRFMPFGGSNSKKQTAADSKAGVDDASGEKSALKTSPLTLPLHPGPTMMTGTSEVETPSESATSYFPTHQVPRSRTLLKATSYLNLRAASNSNGNKKKTGTGTRYRYGTGTGTGTVGQQETPVQGGSVVQGNVNTDDGQMGSSPRVMSPISPVTAMATTATTRPSLTHNPWSQDTLQGGVNRSGSPVIFNIDDQTQHRPSLLRVAEALQIEIMSTNNPFQDPSAPSRRPGLVPTGSTVAGLDAIPGRFRSHIMQTIEGVYQLTTALEKEKTRAKEAEDARERDLEQFAGLVEEWGTYETVLNDKIRHLEDRIHQLEAMQAATTAAVESGVLFMHGSGHVPTDSEQFAGHAEATLRDICDTDVNKRLEEKEKENIRQEEQSALMTDLGHDKAVSDGLAKGMAAEMAKRPSALQDQWAGGRQPATRSEISAAQEWEIQKLAERIGYDHDSETSAPTSAPKKDKGKQKAVAGEQSNTFQRKQKIARGKRPAKNKESSESSSESYSSASSSSSSTSSDEELGTFDPDNGASIHATADRAGPQL